MDKHNRSVQLAAVCKDFMWLNPFALEDDLWDMLKKHKSKNTVQLWVLKDQINICRNFKSKQDLCEQDSAISTSNLLEISVAHVPIPSASQ